MLGRASGGQDKTKKPRAMCYVVLWMDTLQDRYKDICFMRPPLLPSGAPAASAAAADGDRHPCKYYVWISETFLRCAEAVVMSDLTPGSNVYSYGGL